MAQNFRSTANIQAVTDALGVALVYDHRLWTTNAPGPVPVYHAARRGALRPPEATGAATSRRRTEP